LLSLEQLLAAEMKPFLSLDVPSTHKSN
jgi:hypothetical protein